MLGWSITIFNLTPEGCKNFYLSNSPEKAILARWQVSLGGLFWIERFIAQGKATQVPDSSFPTRYLTQASHVQALKLLEDVRPRPTLARPLPGTDEKLELFQGSGWINKMEIYPERLAQCAAQSMLTIDAWDLM